MKVRPLQIECTIRVSDDSFESRLSLPVAEATPEKCEAVAKAWIGALSQAIKMCTPEEK